MRTNTLHSVFYRTSNFGIAFGITMVVLMMAGSAFALDPGGTVSSTQFDSESQAFLNLINNYRAQNNLGTLSVDAKLEASASWMSNDMLNNCVAGKYSCSHTDSTGRAFDVRLRDFGYPAGTTAAAAENIAWGGGGSIKTAQQAFDLWKNSPGHNTNMLGSSYVAIGISRSCNSGNDCAWVTDFGSKIVESFGTGPAPTPTITPTPTATPIRTPMPTVTPTPTPILTPVPAPVPVSGSISGYSINDINRNGQWDAGENGLSGWKIRLTGISKDGTYIRKEIFTDALGFYKFYNIPAGRYNVREKLNTGFVATGPNLRVITLAAGENSVNNNFMAASRSN